MRRIYKNTKQRKKIEKKALETLRDVRRQIDPDVLARAKTAIEASGQNPFEGMMDNQPQGTETHVPIDREKNLATIMKFLEGKKNNPVFMTRIKEMLLDNQ